MCFSEAWTYTFQIKKTFSPKMCRYVHWTYSEMQ